jgi:DNA-binding HxlR family transcriptional regulator
MAKPAHGACGVEVLLGVLDGKWAVRVIGALLHGPHRFGQLEAALAPISPKILTDRLRAFERQGIVTRAVYAEVPPRVVYTLTPLGRTMAGVLKAMDEWGTAHAAELSSSSRRSGPRP